MITCSTSCSRTTCSRSQLAPSTGSTGAVAVLRPAAPCPGSRSASGRAAASPRDAAPPAGRRVPRRRSGSAAALHRQCALAAATSRGPCGPRRGKAVAYSQSRSDWSIASPPAPTTAASASSESAAKLVAPTTRRRSSIVRTAERRLRRGPEWPAARARAGSSRPSRRPRRSRRRPRPRRARSPLPRARAWRRRRRREPSRHRRRPPSPSSKCRRSARAERSWKVSTVGAGSMS